MSGNLRDHALSVMRTPRTLDIDITSRCNLRCSYCYFFEDSSRRYEDLPAMQWIALFDECGQLGVMDVTIAGGEPFARPDLPLLLDSIVANRMRFTILTNGTLVTRDVAAVIARTRRCDSVQVSIDGSRAPIHDAVRGTGAFDAALRGIRILQDQSINVSVRMTIQQHNFADIEATVAMLIDELGVTTVTTNAAGPLGSCRTNRQSLELSTEQRRRAMVQLLALVQRYGDRVSAQAGPLTEARMWPAMKRALREGAGEFTNCGHLTGCGCMSSRIAVRADGVITPCTMLPGIVLGRVGRDDLGTVWREHPELMRLRRRHEHSLREFDSCRACAYVPYCTGNCPGVREGEADGPATEGCLRRYELAGGTLAEVDV